MIEKAENIDGKRGEERAEDGGGKGEGMEGEETRGEEGSSS